MGAKTAQAPAKTATPTPTDSQRELLKALSGKRVLRTFAAKSGISKAAVETPKGVKVEGITVRRVVADVLVKNGWVTQVGLGDDGVKFTISDAGKAAAKSKPAAAKKAKAKTAKA